MLTLTGAQALVRTLAAEPIHHAFGVVGGKLGPLLHAIHQSPRLRFVGVRHEAAAAMMAAGVAAGTGRVALALGEMGPGGLNLISGLGMAWADHLPVLAITTNQHREASYPALGMFMDLDTLAMTRPITRWNAVVSSPRRIPELVRRALREAHGSRPGPVHLDIPHDVLSASCDYADDEFELAPERYRSLVGPRPDAGLLAQAAHLLRQARRPLIVAGGGVVRAGATAQVRELARRLAAPVIPTQMALGVVPTDSDSFIGHGGLIAGAPVRQAFAEADVILALGCRFSSWLWDEHGPFARRDQALVQVNTDHSALGHPAIHALGIQADAGQMLDDLLAVLPSAPSDPGWLALLRQSRLRYEAVLVDMAQSEQSPMHPAALAQAVADALPADALAVYDGGHTSFWSNDFTAAHAPRTRLHEPGMSHLGFGLPYANALQLEFPERRVVHITGDGSFGFTLNELDTARRYGLPVITIVHNNAAWGIIRAGQRAHLGVEVEADLSDTDYAAIARGFGCHGEVVTTPEAFGPAFSRALASGLPAVLDCHTAFVPHPAGPLFAAMNRYGAASGAH